MISHQVTRVFVSTEKKEAPKGYTLKRDFEHLLGLNSGNIHIHIDSDAEVLISESRFCEMVINLSCTPRLPLITIGHFDKRLSRMLVAMEVLEG